MVSQKIKIEVSTGGEERWLFVWLAFWRGSGITVETDPSTRMCNTDLLSDFVPRLVGDFVG